MRIAFIAQPTDSLRPPVQGGSLALWIDQVAQECAHLGHEPLVIANHGSAFASECLSRDGIDYCFTPTAPNRGLNMLARRSRGLSQSAKLLPEFAAPSLDVLYALSAARHCRSRRVDAVHIMNYSQFAPIVRRAYPGCVIALHMECEWLSQLDRKTIDARLDSVDLVIGCSEYITRRAAEAHPRHAAKCVTVPNAAPLVKERGRNASGRRRILFVGRVSPEKGVHDLIDAFHHVLARFPDASLHLVGGIGSAPFELLVGLSNEPAVQSLVRFYDRGNDPPRDVYEEKLKELAGSELGRRIHFEGRVDHGRIGEFFDESDVLVNPSLSEAFGMSLVEAMMYGVPVVATRVGGMTEIVEATGGGVLVDPAQPRALAEGICTLLEDPARAAQIGAAARQVVVEKYSWPAITRELVAVLEAVRRSSRSSRALAAAA